MDTANNTTQKTGEMLPKGRVLRGTVVSSKMQDTIAVAVERFVKHKKYKKFMRQTKKYLVHDKGNTAQEGDVVEIRETRPISRHKRFTLVGKAV